MWVWCVLCVCVLFVLPWNRTKLRTSDHPVETRTSPATMCITSHGPLWVGTMRCNHSTVNPPRGSNIGINLCLLFVIHSIHVSWIYSWIISISAIHPHFYVQFPMHIIFIYINVIRKISTAFKLRCIRWSGCHRRSFHNSFFFFCAACCYARRAVSSHFQ